MAITIDWQAKIIHVPKSDTVLVQSSPKEIRQLDLNTFRLALKDLEDGEEGIPYLDTHSHNAPVTVGGATLARVVEIINDYTVTFEDGQYAVNLINANSNVGDRVNVNQVSVRTANSAGLIETQVESSAPTTTEITTAIWDEPQSSHTVPGSMGETLQKAKINAQNSFALAASGA